MLLTGKRIAKELVAEAVVTYVKSVVVVQVLRELGPFWASAVLGLFWVANGMTFATNLPTVGEPIYQIFFFIITLVTNGRNKVANDTGRVVLDIFKFLVVIACAIAGGISSNWVSGSLLSSAYAFQSVHANGVAAFVVSALVAIIAQHAVLLPMIGNADGYTSMIGVGAATSAASVFLYLLTQGVLDSAVVIAIASALALPGLTWLWLVLSILLIGSGITLVLYFFLWDDVFSASAQIARRQIQAEVALNNKLSVDSSDEELVAPSASRKTTSRHHDVMAGM